MSLFGGVAQAWRNFRAEGNPNDERYWGSSGQVVQLTGTGIVVTPTLAFQVSCVFHGIRLIAETLGSFPLIIYRELEDGDKERAKDDPLWLTLRRQPNEWQTAQQWRETMTAHAVAWGGGYSEIIGWERGAVDALVPLDPEALAIEQMSSRRLRFILTNPDGTKRTLVQEQVFRLQGLALHKFMPLNLLRLAREAIGLWLAQERFNSLFFSQGAKPGLALEHPGKLSAPAQARLREQTQAQIGGLNNAHKVMVAEEGMKLHEFGFNAKDSQMTEARDAQVSEIARWLNIPQHMFKTGEQPTFASIEQFAREFVDYTLRPWCVRWEQAIGRDLITDPDVYVEHLMDVLLRGSTLERYQAYNTAIMGGFMSENEARSKEGWNRVPGLDTPRRSVNQDRGADPQGGDEPPPAPPPARRKKAPKDGDDEEDAIATSVELTVEPAVPRRLLLIAEGTARRVVRKEIARVRDSAVKLSIRPADWNEWLSDFYSEHAGLVSEAMQLEPAVARGYAEAHRLALGARGVSAMENWETTAVHELTALATERSLQCPTATAAS